MADVSVTARGEWARYIEPVEEAALFWLALLDKHESELSILLTDDEEIHRLNQAYRQRDRPTDVLSFSQREGDFPGPAAVLGDVVISMDTAHRQAHERGHSFDVELLELLAHGLLHLLGYDHEISAAEHERHLGKQAEILAAFAAR
ncbi:MAG: rRNA maturation RNase YbeY [Candidatus Binatia bacterium]|jgi:probable rRNA maturation factor|nr:rRNA maturation RNase YbeY [Candidatus Binatia bacterium]MDG1960438.1 rRNA maturation RNase YbeY [Candidatus Binatia bacterium]MDG2009481.1 rRNA maturation RNase YbeY [Candidatus Binatia bacterium]HAC78834.1 rRNA maturation RNase YbeY [Deltaproteobacteria bacterium]